MHLTQIPNHLSLKALKTQWQPLLNVIQRVQRVTSEIGQVEHSQTTLEYLRSAANSPSRSEAVVETDRETHQQVLNGNRFQQQCEKQLNAMTSRSERCLHVLISLFLEWYCRFLLIAVSIYKNRLWSLNVAWAKSIRQEAGLHVSKEIILNQQRETAVKKKQKTLCIVFPGVMKWKSHVAL